MAEWRRPESVLVLVYADRSRVLLLKRKAPFLFWQSVTGSLEPGESAAEAARRELAEETGLSVAPDSAHVAERRFVIDPRWRNRYAPGVSENLEYEFRARVPTASAVQVDENEHSAYAWMPIDAAIERVWSWTNREALIALREEL
ncbi:MAG: dihydroneopterin triphosphate diphosphatase [Pseudomonadota bacterium]